MRGRPAEVIWTVDGKSFARVAAPYSVSWPLSPGEHRIEARAGEQRSRPALVTIYAPAGAEAPQGPPAGAPEGGSPLSRLLPPEDEARVQ